MVWGRVCVCVYVYVSECVCVCREQTCTLGGSDLTNA
jgi:hypothetical protein